MNGYWKKNTVILSSVDAGDHSNRPLIKWISPLPWPPARLCMLWDLQEGLGRGRKGRKKPISYFRKSLKRNFTNDRDSFGVILVGRKVHLARRIKVAGGWGLEGKPFINLLRSSEILPVRKKPLNK